MAKVVRSSKSLARQISDMRAVQQAINRLPETVAHRVAERAAVAITEQAQRSYDAGQTVYGDARPRGESGGELDLVETNKVRSNVRFEANGRVMRAVLPTRYAPYLVGKYRVLPMGDLPRAWVKTIEEITAEELSRAVDEGVK